MKNLMLGLTVAVLCGSAVAADATEIVSSKIVGYRNTSATGYTLATSTFIPSDGDTFSFDNIKVTGVESDEVTIRVIQANGKFGDTYVWNNNGWYKKDGSGSVTTDKLGTMDRGLGFIVYHTGKESPTIKATGLDCTNKVTRTLSAGYTLIGSPFNSGVSIQKFKLNLGGMYKANLQSIGANGQTGEMYYWVSDEIAGENQGGWYNEALERLEDATNTVKPGTTYLLYTVSAATLTIGD